MEFMFPVLLLLLLAWVTGSALERQHYRSILKREQDYRDMTVCNFEWAPDGAAVDKAVLVQGSVVISVDYFKRLVAALKGLVGGRIKAYEPLLERARREALLRMIEDARRQGFQTVVNVRLETSRIVNATRNDYERLAGVEMLAYGTAINYVHAA